MMEQGWTSKVFNLLFLNQQHSHKHFPLINTITSLTPHDLGCQVLSLLGLPFQTSWQNRKSPSSWPQVISSLPSCHQPVLEGEQLQNVTVALLAPAYILNKELHVSRWHKDWAPAHHIKHWWLQI